MSFFSTAWPDGLSRLLMEDVSSRTMRLVLSSVSFLGVQAKLTEVQHRRICGRNVAEVRKHLDEAIGRSFLSGDFRARLRALTMEKLSVFGQDA